VHAEDQTLLLCQSNAEIIVIEKHREHAEEDQTLHCSAEAKQKSL
jgi:hypothetical protein